MTLYLGSFYRLPEKIDNDYFEEYISSLSQIMSNRNAHVLVGGDFNCESHASTSCGTKRQSQQHAMIKLLTCSLLMSHPL